MLKSVIYLSVLCIFINLYANTATAENKKFSNYAQTVPKLSPLAKAIIRHDESQALNLIQNDADLRAYQSEDSIRKIVTPNVKTTYVGGINQQAFPLIILAAASGQDAIIKAIKDQDEDAVYLKDFHGNDALMWAAREGHVATVTLLLSYGFDPLYLSGKSKTSAYNLSLEKDKYQVLDAIILHLIQKKQTEQLAEAIWFLSGSDQTELLRKYLQLGTKDTYKAIKPRTSLMRAADWGKLENFKLLVKYGSDPYESNIGQYDYNYDPLTYAINNGELLTYLLENYDYNLNKVFEGQNYLHLSYNRYHRPQKNPFLLLLKKSGLDIDSVDNYGDTLLDNAVENADIEYVRFFLSLGMSEQSITKALQNAQESLGIHEKEYRRAKNSYDLERIDTLSIIGQILQKKIKLKTKADLNHVFE